MRLSPTPFIIMDCSKSSISKGNNDDVLQWNLINSNLLSLNFQFIRTDVSVLLKLCAHQCVKAPTDSNKRLQHLIRTQRATGYTLNSTPTHATALPAWQCGRAPAAAPISCLQVPYFCTHYLHHNFFLFNSSVGVWVICKFCFEV